jgi:hypothetical protein
MRRENRAGRCAGRTEKFQLRAVSSSISSFLPSYGAARLDRSIDVVLRWDHRITDAAFITRTLARLERVLNEEIAAELNGIQLPPATKPRRSCPEASASVPPSKPAPF